MESTTYLSVYNFDKKKSITDTYNNTYLELQLMLVNSIDKKSIPILVTVSGPITIDRSAIDKKYDPML